jgi:lipopolysaccharide/colanic/teichoic acid biosynthesis glycosyltransferase
MSAILSDLMELNERPLENQEATPLEFPCDLAPPRYLWRKAAADRILAALLLTPCLPVILVLVMLVRLTTPGPGIYPQIRVGRKGRHFTLYKIRTMVHNAENGSGPVWTKAADPRITRLGRVLRKLHLDEFPQLFNVLKGEMSLVGPRPERPEFIHVLTRRLPDYARRLAVPPGITGLAQLNLPPDSDLDSVRRKLVLDLEYIDRASAWMDVRLALCTAARIFKLPVIHLLGLHRNVSISPSSQPQVTLFPERLETAAKAEVKDPLAHHVKPDGDGHPSAKSPKKHLVMSAVLVRTKPR